MFTIPTVVYHVLRELAGAMRQEREIKGNKQGKKKSDSPYLQML